MGFWKRIARILGVFFCFLAAIQANASLGSPLKKDKKGPPPAIFGPSYEEELDERIALQETLSYDRKIFDASKYPPESRVRKHTNFWIRIYTEFTTWQGLVHDSKHIGVVYESLDFKGLSRSKRRAMIRASKRKWNRVLLSIHKKQAAPETMNDDEQRVYQLFSKIDEPNKFLNARRTKRIRFQLGQKNRFRTALENSGQFLGMMEKIFRADGLPIELTRLPFVESSFNIKARSKVGASGVWQFIRSTGRVFMKIDSVLDERNDPYRATAAAAKLLKTNFESLQHWPVAIIAYNHGRKGMMKAVRKMGTADIEDIVRDYRGKRFGFASRNFFMELLAAIEVEKNAHVYFGELKRKKPLEFVEVGVADFISARHLTKFLGINFKQFKYLNPGLTSNVYKGKKRIPVGYRLRIPADWGVNKGGPRKAFWTGYLKIPSAYKYPRQRGVRRKISSKK